MELNIGVSEWNKNVDDYNGRNFESHAAPAEKLSTVSSPFMVFFKYKTIETHARAFLALTILAIGTVIWLIQCQAVIL